MSELEDKLETMRGPAMPPDVEARLRQQLSAEARGHPPARPSRSARRFSYAQVVLLAILLAAAAWTVRYSVMPVLHAAWERAHCLVSPSQGKP